MGSNVHGNKNEVDLKEAIDGKVIGGLNNNLKDFVKFIAIKEGLEIDDTTIVGAIKVGGNYKSDLNLSILDKTYGVSVKTGSGNSVHQEKSCDFIEFIRDELNASQQICDSFEWFIDSIEDAPTLKKQDPDRINLLRTFVNNNRKELSNRFLREGLSTSNFVDYIYYGTPVEGTWGNINDIFDFIDDSESSTRAALKMGPLGLQAWNRVNEAKRYTLQVKWTSIENDLESLR
jgi:hypothetical protein